MKRAAQTITFCFAGFLFLICHPHPHTCEQFSPSLITTSLSKENVAQLIITCSFFFLLWIATSNLILDLMSLPRRAEEVEGSGTQGA